MSKKQVLVVWSDVPEEIASFVSLTVDEVEVEKLKGFHNHYINSCGTPDDVADEMNAFFYNEKGYFKFKENKVEGPVCGDDYDLIVQCGFIL